MTKLKMLVSEKELKAANLTGDEDVRKMNLWAKGQQNHRSNEYREIFDGDEQTEYCICVKDNTIVLNPDLY